MSDDESAATVRVANPEGRGALLTVALLGLVFGGVLVGAGPEGYVAAGLVLVPSVVVLARAPRMGLEATGSEVIVRNLGRTYRIRRAEVTEVEVAGGSNVSGLTSVLRVHRRDGRPVEAAGTASYSQAKVEEMRARLPGWVPE